MNIIGGGVTAPQSQSGGEVGDHFYVPIGQVGMDTGEKLETAYIEGTVTAG